MNHLATQFVTKDKLQINQVLLDCINTEIIPGSGMEVDSFWETFQQILEEFIPRNKDLLEKRDLLQNQLDDWHKKHQGKKHDQKKYVQHLKEIGYLVDDGPDFSISTENVDPEIATIAGPQLVVPINNARFALNASNARWGSLFDALYGTDIIPNRDDTTKVVNGNKFNPKRGEKVIARAIEFLNASLPLTKGDHSMVSAYTLVNKKIKGKVLKQLEVYLNNGHITELKYPSAFRGYAEDRSNLTLLFRNNGLHFEIEIDPCSPIGKTSLSGLKDIILEAALTTIQDCEDSVTAVDAEDKTIVYRNWLGLMQGDLEHKFTKNGKEITRKLNTNRCYINPENLPLTLSGRSLLMIRNVGHLMTTDAILYKSELGYEEIPEGIMDGVITALAFLHDFHGNSVYKNSASNSMYIVKPKMHGPEEVRFTVDLFSAIETALSLPQNTLKIGLTDEERRTTVNLKSCIREAQKRLIFINTGFLDRTGDEIHTSLEAGAFLPKEKLKGEPWIQAYEDWNVDIGLACGLAGKAQIGKGMWAMPDLMADMLKTKIQHPLSGANCAWVPSPTAATLHAMHYHQVLVRDVQHKLTNRKRANLNDILTIPLAPDTLKNSSQVSDDLDNNAQSILGYVVRWIDAGIGCSKVPDSRHIGLMEDRATLRISSQIIANWLHHGVCTEDQVTNAFKKMAVFVDEQNANDPSYKPMSPHFDGIAFQAALDLALKGREQPNGYTEPLLHAYRIKQKKILKHPSNRALSPFFDLKTDSYKQKYLEVYSRGIEVLRLTALNKGTAFTHQERIEFGFEGLLPPVVVTLHDQVLRLYAGFSDLPSDIAKYQFLRAVQERNEVLFYALISDYLEEMMPIIYTPTVGKAVQEYSSLYRSPRGLTFTAENIKRADTIVKNYPWNDVRMIVATDSSAILGIGDQGHGGLAISIGKLALYTAGGGLSPLNTLAVNIDVGTDREDLRNESGYLGVREKRLTGDAYFKVMDDFVAAVKKRWPKAIIQWEDFAKDAAFAVLKRYKDVIPSFNDDIQGTGAVVLAGLLNACKMKGETLSDQKIVVVGAGAGGVGVAKVIQDGLVREGLSREQARRQMFIMDEFGLVVEGISPDAYKKPIMQFKDTYESWGLDAEIPSLLDVIKHAKPTILLGLTGVSGLFNQAVIEGMAKSCKTPIIFPLSNPTSNVEAIPQDIFNWTKGQAIVASGSPFSPITMDGKTHIIGQGNNAFIFPGLGFAAVLGECQQISESMIIESAYALADYTAEHYLQDGLIFPPISDLQKVSMEITKRVLALTIKEGIAKREGITENDIDSLIKEHAWHPEYLPYVAA